MQRNVKSRKAPASSDAPDSSSASAAPASTVTRRRKTKRSSSSVGGTQERILFMFVGAMMLMIAGAFIYQFIVLHNDSNAKTVQNNVANAIQSKDSGNMRGKSNPQVDASVSVTTNDSASAKASASANDHIASNFVSNGPPHLSPPVPYLPIFPPIPNAETLIQQVLDGNPTMTGVIALLQNYMAEFHDENMRLSSNRADGAEILDSFYKLASKHLIPFDQAYKGKPIFPIRKDGSVFLSLASFREHLLNDTLQYAFDNAKNPDKLFIGAVVQNCFGTVNPDGTIDPSGTPCKTGAQVIGKNKKGKDMTKVSDAPPDKNGIYDFCTNPKYKKYCDAGQVRVLYVHETESLGPAMARYHASKLWGGESYFVQTDSHLQFAVHWDQKYIDEFKAAKSYPKVVLSSYPPGFNPSNGNNVHESPGARLCYCETRMEDPNPIIRINTGSSYNGQETRPTQIPFVAAGFFFTSAEWLIDVPFDPYLPWCFMGEEIALSMRSWTRGWDIYAPRKNLIAHQYRPGRMGLPKFWGTVNRLYKRPGMNTKLQGSVIYRVKHMVGYPDATLEKLTMANNLSVLQDLEHYGLGTTRSAEAYMAFAGISIDNNHDALACHSISWCNSGQLK